MRPGAHIRYESIRHSESIEYGGQAVVEAEASRPGLRIIWRQSIESEDLTIVAFKSYRHTCCRAIII